MDDVALANLLSLLEGSAVAEEDARRALHSAGGNVELAICRLFAGPGDEIIDLDADSTTPSAPSASSTSAPSKREEKKRKSSEKKEGPGVKKKAQAAPKAPKAPKGSPSAPSKAVKRELSDDGEHQSAVEVGTEKAVAVQASPADADWQIAPEDTWMPFSTSLGGLRWREDVLLKDPPCLSLRQNQDEGTKELGPSRGHMHCAYQAGLLPKVEQMQTAMMSLEGQRMSVRTQLLSASFETMLEQVRYPPSSLSFTWRMRQVEPTKMRQPAPVDLMGPLPPRPFKLLDNTNDAAAEQPPDFVNYPLRPEQLRSLQWMLSRENLSEDEAFLVEWRRFFTTWERKSEEREEDQFVPGACVEVLPTAQGPFFKDGQLVEAQELHGQQGEVAHSSESGVVVKFGLHHGVRCPVQELRFVDQGRIEPGSRVMLIPDLKAPAYGWGGVQRNMVGIFLRHLQDERTVQIKWPTHPHWKGKMSEIRLAEPLDQKMPFVLDLRIQAAFPVRGGILADKIGYGKTATTIALIDQQLNQPAPQVPEVDRGNFLPAKGTLIIVPSNLFEQWLNEISKFVWDGRNLRTSMRCGWSPVNCPLKIFAMANVVPLQRSQAKRIAEADVVICSYRLLYSQVYLKRRQEICGGTELSTLPNRIRALLHGAKMSSGKKGATVHNWEDLEFPVLEMFYWRRVVFDEFHELESFESVQQNSLQFLRSHYRWGLTGTPPVDNNAGVIFMSSLFRVDLPGYLTEGSRLGSLYVDLSAWENDRLLSESSVHFLDEYVRQNTAELPHIALEEHVVVVKHTSAERALYLGQAHDAPDFGSRQAFESEESIASLERLLKLCSHFQVGGSDQMGNASMECERITDQKERRLVRARNQLRRCSRVIVMLQRLLSQKSKRRKFPWRGELEKMEAKLSESGDSAKELAKELQAEAQAAASETPEETLQQLDGHKPKSEDLVKLLAPGRGANAGTIESWTSFVDAPPEAQVLEKLLMSQAKEQAQNLQELHDACTSWDFFRRTVAALKEGSKEARTCSVCMEDDLPLQKLAITPCAHAFCIGCLRDIVAKFSRCSLCQRPLAQKDVRAVANEIEEPKAEEPTGGVAPGGVSLDKYGTKLALLVEKLKQLRREDQEAKVILFVQFDDLKRKVGSALSEFGIPVATLQGAVGERAGIIRDWQNNPQSKTFVLLLSLQQSASGTNLTAASHVIFLHPMLAPNADRAVGYEMQAIGRARRHGQRRSVVHVWRFVTADTLEQQITEQHQGALWRQGAASAASAAEAGAGS